MCAQSSDCHHGARQTFKRGVHFDTSRCLATFKRGDYLDTMVDTRTRSGVMSNVNRNAVEVEVAKVLGEHAASEAQ